MQPPPPSASLRVSLLELAQASLRSESGRRLAYFGCALAAFAAVQAAYALSVGSLGLLSDAMLRLLHVSGLAISLLADAGGASGATAAGASFAFSYGLAPRLEVLAAFSQVRRTTERQQRADNSASREEGWLLGHPIAPLPAPPPGALFSVSRFAHCRARAAAPAGGARAV